MTVDAALLQVFPETYCQFACRRLFGDFEREISKRDLIKVDKERPRSELRYLGRRLVDEMRQFPLLPCGMCCDNRKSRHAQP